MVTGNNNRLIILYNLNWNGGKIDFFLSLLHSSKFRFEASVSLGQLPEKFKPVIFIVCLMYLFVDVQSWIITELESVFSLDKVREVQS